MRNYQFKLAEHREYGNMGWQLLSQPGFDPVNGAGIAHDILEHFSDSTEAAHDEFMALGAFLYVRGERYAFAKGSMVRNNIGSWLSGDIQMVVEKISSGEVHDLKPCPRVRLADTDVKESIDYALKEFKKEWDNYCADFTVDKSVLQNIKRWMIKGYQRARRRYNHLKDYNVTQLFLDIEKKAQEYLEKATRFFESGYQEIKLLVKVDFGRGNAELLMLTQDDY